MIWRFLSNILNINDVPANKAITLTFPLPIKEKKVNVGGKEYSLTIKGNVAMDCKPAGKRYPFFIHPEYNSARVPQKTKTMFVPKRLPFLDGAVKVKTITKEQ